MPTAGEAEAPRPGAGECPPGRPPLLAQPVFDVGSETFCWEDVVWAARLWGDWNTLVAGTVAGLACQQHAEASGEDPPEDAIETAADEFRYARDLVSADEMNAWLSGWDLTVEDWMDFVERSALRAEWSEDLPSLVARYPASEEEVDEVLLVEAICSGTLAAAARKLAGRAAIWASSGETATLGTANVEAGRRPLGGGSRKRRERGLLGLSPAASHRRIEAIAQLEAHYQRFRTETVTPQAVERQIALRRLDWIRVDCQRAAFATAEVAHEALLCVRDDGRELAAVAADAGVDCDTSPLYVDEAPAVLQDRLRSARAGDLFGPVPRHETFELYWIVDKVWPSPDDPEVRRRAEHDLLASALDREVNKRVRWRRRL